MKQYHKHLEEILEKGDIKSPAREGSSSTMSLFGYQNKYDLRKGFPLLTTKKINFKHIVVELLWFLKGDINIKYLIDNGCNIWNEDAYNYYLKIAKIHKNENNLFSYEEFVNYLKDPKILPDEGRTSNQSADYKLGDCGKQYGWLWRNWKKGNHYEYEGEYYPSESIDQIKELIEGLKNNPSSRRHIITAWNPATLNDMALHACHSFVQFNCSPISIENQILFKTDTSDKGWTVNHNRSVYYLDCQLYQRSADIFLGVPYNIASYALLTEIIARICNMVPRYFIHSFGDSHIYEDHLPQVHEILERDPEKYKLPKLLFEDVFHCEVDAFNSNNLTLEDFLQGLDFTNFKLENYQSYPGIKAKLITGLK